MYGQFTSMVWLALGLAACGGTSPGTSEPASGTSPGPATSSEVSSSSSISSADDTGSTTGGSQTTASESGDVPPASIGPEDYIRGTPYPRMVIEIDAVEGFAPRDEAMVQIPASLEALLDKPAGVEAVLDQTLEAGASDGVWTFAELDALAAETFDLDVPDDTVKMHVLFLDGRYMGDDPDAVILGLAWHRTELAIFKETIQAVCVGQVGMGLEERLCAGTERSVWVHEIGHLLGLVNLGTPMLTAREDPDHEHHDVNQECVMYWAAERQNAVQQLANQLMETDVEYLDFDDACVADIAAVRDQ